MEKGETVSFHCFQNKDTFYKAVQICAKNRLSYFDVCSIRSNDHEDHDDRASKLVNEDEDVTMW